MDHGFIITTARPGIDIKALPFLQGKLMKELIALGFERIDYGTGVMGHTREPVLIGIEDKPLGVIQRAELAHLAMAYKQDYYILIAFGCAFKVATTETYMGIWESQPERTGNFTVDLNTGDMYTINNY